MLVFRGEYRFCEIDLSTDPGIVAGAAAATLTSVVCLHKRGEAEVEGVVDDDPAPTLVGNDVRFFADFADVAAGRYIFRAIGTLNNTEIWRADVAVVVE
jgi:hypothetical protein